MTSERVEVLILGAGPAGMAAALEMQKSNKSLLVIEKNDAVGGLARTLKYGEFRTDIGPHRFYSQNKYLYVLIKDLLAEKWIKVNRLTRFYIQGKFLLYPIHLKNIFLNIGPAKLLKILFEYFSQRFKKIIVKTKPRSFQDQIIADFGRTLAQLNILNYTEKVWGLACTQLSPDWAQQRIKGLTFAELIKKAFRKSKDSPKSLVDQFYYPETGTGLIYETMKDKVLLKPGMLVETDSYPKKILHDQKRIIEIELSVKGNTKWLKPEEVISSIPITEFIRLLDPVVPPEVLEAAGMLRFRAHVALFVKVERTNVFPDQWIYFPDKEIPFGRISEPKNFSARMSPPDKTSLLIEFFCWENDHLWNQEKQALLELALSWLDKFSLLREKEIIDCYMHRERYAYPVYTLGYKEPLAKINNYLSRFQNLQNIGRSGMFRYNNQDHALEMGILAARNILEGKIYDIGQVGGENKYFERGYSR